MQLNSLATQNSNSDIVKMTSAEDSQAIQKVKDNLLADFEGSVDNEKIPSPSNNSDIAPSKCETAVFADIEQLSKDVDNCVPAPASTKPAPESESLPDQNTVDNKVQEDAISSTNGAKSDGDSDKTPDESMDTNDNIEEAEAEPLCELKPAPEKCDEPTKTEPEPEKVELKCEDPTSMESNDSETTHEQQPDSNMTNAMEIQSTADVEPDSNIVEEGSKVKSDLKGETPKKTADSTTKNGDDIELIEEVTQEKEKPSTSSVKPAESGGKFTSQRLQEELISAMTNSEKIKEAADSKLVEEMAKFIIQQGQKHPQEVRRIIEKKEISVPTSVILPPSQVVSIIAEYEPEKPLATMLSQVFDSATPETQGERLHKNTFKMRYPAPHMTRQLYDIGLQLAQESTYTDIVNMKNLPEKPRNPETYKQVVDQVKPVLAMLNKHMATFKLELKKCHLCNFKSESSNAILAHLKFPHFKHGKWYCGFCDFSDSREVEIKKHYSLEHGLKAEFETPMQKAPCNLCQKEFQFKGMMQTHLKSCKQTATPCMKPTPYDTPMINHWLWPQPADGHNGIPGGVRVTQERYSQQSRVMGNPNAKDPFTRNATIIRAAPQQPPRVRGHTVTTPNYYNNNNMGGQMRGARPRMPNMTAAPNRNMISLNNRVNSNQQIPSLGVLAQPSKCEICDMHCESRIALLSHLQRFHSRMAGKQPKDMTGGAPLACSRCRDRFWTYEGLERHLLMAHCLVTNDLLAKAQKKEDSGRCKVCNKQYAFNLLQHLVVDHKQKLCSAEILYSCDVCTYQCTSYNELDEHLLLKHNTGQGPVKPQKRGAMGAAAGQPPAKKTMPMMAGRGAGPSRASPMQNGAVSHANVKRPLQSPVTKKVRYTCTPCALKFEQYQQVIKHWQEKHLAKVSVRLDRCDLDMIKTNLLTDNPGLDVDLSAPDSPPPQVASTAPSNDIICLD